MQYLSSGVKVKKRPTDLLCLYHPASYLSKTKQNPNKDFSLPSLLMGFPGGSDSKESVCNAGDPGLIPESLKDTWRREWLTTSVLLPGESSLLKTIHGKVS